MSAVKRVFTHSAIRSAIRKPFVPGDDGYREYLKRSVFEFNGTQSINLSDAITPDRIVLEVYCTGGESNIPGSPTVELNKVVTLDYTYSGSALQEDLFLGFEGFIFSLKMYSAGALKSDMRFDESGSDYQSNHEFVSENVLGKPGWSTPNAYTAVIAFNTPERISFSTPPGEEGRVARMMEPLIIGQVYKVRLSLLAHTSGVTFLAREGSAIGYGNIITAKSWGGDGQLEFHFVATTTDANILLQIPIDASCDISLIVEKWSGVILQNALPDDWMQLERKRWWDYWLSTSVLENKLENYNNITTSGGWTVAGNMSYLGTTNLLGLVAYKYESLAASSSYVRRGVAGLVAGNKYTVSMITDSDHELQGNVGSSWRGWLLEPGSGWQNVSNIEIKQLKSGVYLWTQTATASNTSHYVLAFPIDRLSGEKMAISNISLVDAALEYLIYDSVTHSYKRKLEIAQ